MRRKNFSVYKKPGTPRPTSLRTCHPEMPRVLFRGAAMPTPSLQIEGPRVILQPKQAQSGAWHDSELGVAGGGKKVPAQSMPVCNYPWHRQRITVQLCTGEVGRHSKQRFPGCTGLSTMRL